jgi:hypothetical protein
MNTKSSDASFDTFIFVLNLFFLNVLDVAIIFRENENFESLYNQTHSQFAQEDASFFRKIIDGLRYIFSDSYIAALAFLKTSTVVALGPIDVVSGHSSVEHIGNFSLSLSFTI